MKTLDTTNTLNASTSHKPVRFIMTLTGIVIAMLCLLALAQEARSTERMDARIPRLIETSKIVAADLVMEVKTWL